MTIAPSILLKAVYTVMFINFSLFFGQTLIAQEVEVLGQLRVVDGTQGVDKVLTSDATGLAEWKDIPSQIPTATTQGDMLYWDGNAWTTVPAGTQGQNLTFCDNKPQWGPCQAAATLTTQTYTVTQTWDQETNYDRDVHIEVPAGNGPFPAVILLHGNGGSGSGFINAFNYLGTDVIRVAPDGYLNSWNVAFENSNAPDVDLISNILAFIKTFSNVDINQISIIGSSNGSAMLNRLLVELPTSSFNNAVNIVSPKVEQFYNNGTFFYDPTGGNAYDTTIVPASDRRILAVSGTADGAVPYTGGNGVVGYQFLAAQNSIYYWAQLNGYTGAQLADASGVVDTTDPDVVKYSYLSGDIVHYKVINGTHGSTGGNAQVKAIITEFLGL